ncbi:MAG TPA: DUF6325 family protein [Ktedonobacteraceae bacterium]|jgi:Family of unknown function (DUF6325)
MAIGPLEYVVIGLQDHHSTSELLPELNAIQENGHIQVRDLLFVNKAADSTVTLQEINDLSEEEQQPYSALQENLTGLLTAQDIEHLAGEIPPGTLAVVVLLEHTWTLNLTEAVRKAGGVLFAGGMVTPEALTQVNAELAAKEEHYA